MFPSSPFSQSVPYIYVDLVHLELDIDLDLESRHRPGLDSHTLLLSTTILIVCFVVFTKPETYNFDLDDLEI